MLMKILTLSVQLFKCSPPQLQQKKKKENTDDWSLKANKNLDPGIEK